MRYEKPPLTLDQQLDLMIQRGLTVPAEDRARAVRWLKHISYYRLSAYFLPFKAGEVFVPGAIFHQIAGLYIFDRKLRLILLDAIERIEVALRTALTYEISHRYGPFGHTDPANFADWFDHNEFMEELEGAEESSKETFVSHFRRKYHEEKHLPLWMAAELLSFGRLSKIYKASHPSIKRKIASRFNVNDKHFASWLHTLNYIRNVCAHHRRLWNRELAVKPALPSLSRAWLYQIPSTDRLYCVLVILRHSLKVVSPDCHWHERLFALFDAHLEVDLAAMQIPANWRQTAPWN